MTFFARRLRPLLWLAGSGVGWFGRLLSGIRRVGEVTFLVRLLHGIRIIIRISFVGRRPVFGSVNSGFGRKIFVFVVGSSRVGRRFTGGVWAWPSASTASTTTSAAGPTTTSGGRTLGGCARRG